VPAALERAAAYSEAGAGCFSPIGLADPEHAERRGEACPLPVNLLCRGGAAEAAALAACGAARISFAAGPWRATMAWAEAQARAALGRPE
ncbi:MAG: isocitrate lyase/phosphoenolpyruvate mutase family protein, partial [Pseudomonadota bacterium]|nr:isocitrate lyase/phosphoenolpyruvate mutase family protein [Pseudomonadota bacterium]